jgi:hypothetical protein
MQQTPGAPISLLRKAERTRPPQCLDGSSAFGQVSPVCHICRTISRHKYLERLVEKNESKSTHRKAQYVPLIEIPQTLLARQEKGEEVVEGGLQHN